MMILNLKNVTRSTEMNIKMCSASKISLCANPLSQRPGQVKLDSDKCKL